MHVGTLDRSPPWSQHGLNCLFRLPTQLEPSSVEPTVHELLFHPIPQTSHLDVQGRAASCMVSRNAPLLHTIPEMKTFFVPKIKAKQAIFRAFKKCFRLCSLWRKGLTFKGSDVRKSGLTPPTNST